MNKLVIEKQLRDWFNLMLLKYAWLIIKFEYNEMENCYMVSFSPSSELDKSIEFSKDALDFENKMNKKYGDDAPLFCDEESLFKLSNKAELLCASHKEPMFNDSLEVNMNFETIASFEATPIKSLDESSFYDELVIDDINKKMQIAA